MRHTHLLRWLARSAALALLLLGWCPPAARALAGCATYHPPPGAATTFRLAILEGVRHFGD